MKNNPSLKSRIYYFAPVAPANHDYERCLYKEVPAIRNKVLGVCKAINSADGSPVIVSTFPTPISNFSNASDADNIPFYTLSSKNKGIYRRFSSMLRYFLFTIKNVSKKDVVLLYNFFPEYIPSAIYAPVFESKKFSERINKVSLFFTLSFVSKKVITVSNKLAISLKLKSRLVVYGISEQFFKFSKHTDILIGNDIRIIYGGAIYHETGLNLFIDAIRIINSKNINSKIQFIVTGFFKAGVFDEIIKETSSNDLIEILLLQKLSAKDYGNLLNDCDIGLSLKLPSGDLADTTFPSKTIEICSTGLLLISTSISDISDIFSKDNAIILKSEDAEELADSILWAMNNKSDARKMARASQAMVREKFSAPAVGKKIMDFIYE